MVNVKSSIPVLFLVNPEGAIGGPRAADEWFKNITDRIRRGVETCCRDVDFTYYYIRDVMDVNNVLVKETDSPGYIVFILNSISGLLKPIIYSGKPVVLVNETYGGSGDYVLEYGEAVKQGYPVIGVSTREPYDPRLLEKMIKYLFLIDKLKNTKILFIVPKAAKYYASLEYPLSIDVYGLLKELVSITGATYVLMDSSEFREKYYDKINRSDAEEIAKKWVENSYKNLEENYEEIVKSAKLYLSIKNAAKDLGINAVAIDCIVLHNTGELDAWPCLAYMQLWYDGIIPVCEADIASTIIILIGKYLLGLNGFITDPAIDEVNDEIIYYHCYAPTNPHGSDKQEYPYVITPAHLGEKRASQRVLFKPGTKITAVGLSLDEKTLTIHTSELVGIEESIHACGNKLVAKTSTKKIVLNWKRRSGWHRVIFLGDHREEFINAARLLRLKTLEEDR